MAKELGLDIAGSSSSTRRTATRRGHGGRAGPRRQGRAVDEGQPAYRRADGRGGGQGDRPAHRPADQPCVHHGCADLPGPLFITDAAINIFPDLETKVDIVQNAIDLHLGLGLGEPRVAILSAVETVNPKIPATLDAAALCKMADRGQIKGGLLDGPLALTTRSAPRPPGSRASFRRSPAARRSWSSPTSRPATCWPRTCPSWPTPTLPASCSGPGADHPDQPRRRCPHPHGVLRGGGALCSRPPHGRGRGGRVMAMQDTLLVVNAGSSSIKFQLFHVTAGARLELDFNGQIEGIGTRPASGRQGRRGCKPDRRAVRAGRGPGRPAALEQLRRLAGAAGRRPPIGDRASGGPWRPRL